MSNIYLDKLLTAIAGGKIDLYLLGKNEYYLPNKWAEEPTDLGSIFSLGLNEYVKLYGEEKINVELENGLLKLLGDPIGTWWVLEIIYEYEFGFLDNAILFKIDLQKLIPKLSQSLLKFKTILLNSTEWTGSRFDDGLWEAIENLISKHNLNVKDPNLKIEIT